MHGKSAMWGTHEELLASIFDALNSANWQRGGGKGPKPKPVERPGQKKSGKSIGKDPIRIDHFDAWWDSH